MTMAYARSDGMSFPMVVHKRLATSFLGALSLSVCVSQFMETFMW